MSNLILRKFALEPPYYYSTLPQDTLADCLPDPVLPIKVKDQS